MRIAVIHGAVSAGAGKDEEDVLVQAAAVAAGLAALGHEPVMLPVTLNLAAAAQALADRQPALAFNLVESLGGRGSLIHLVPSLLDSLGLPYTGAGAEAMMLTSNKRLAKQWLAAAGLPTPPWITAAEMDKDSDGGREGTDRTALGDATHRQGGQGNSYARVAGGSLKGSAAAAKNPGRECPGQGGQAKPIAGPWLIKSVWEHASIGLDEDSVIAEADRDKLCAEMARRRASLGGDCLAEAFIDGREFNLSLLAGDKDGDPGAAAGVAPQVLPPAEIRFDAYPPGKVRVVGYRSKWEEASFEYRHTPRSFAFPEADAALLARLKELALACWGLFGLKGYARVDFRVDGEGRPWILEVNANPCLSPDAGFAAAAREAGLDFTGVLRRIIADAPKK